MVWKFKKSIKMCSFLFQKDMSGDTWCSRVLMFRSQISKELPGYQLSWPWSFPWCGLAHLMRIVSYRIWSSISCNCGITWGWWGKICFRLVFVVTFSSLKVSGWGPPLLLHLCHDWRPRTQTPPTLWACQLPNTYIVSPAKKTGLPKPV